MHGQRKVERSEEEKQETKRRFQKYQAAMTKILKKRNKLIYPKEVKEEESQQEPIFVPRNKQYIRQEIQQVAEQHQERIRELIAPTEATQVDDLWKKTDTLIRVNPDAYPLWNIRRELLFHKLVVLEGSKEQETTPEEVTKQVQKFVDGELNLTAIAIEKVNVKSYGAWHQRRWIIDNFPEYISFAREIKLCNQLLVGDIRNFHCWNYRRHVVKVGNISLEDELQFTEDKIKSNFSNYSAWHYRAILLTNLKKISVATLGEEMRFLRNATYTQPADQSIWFYQRWILRELVNLFGKTESQGRGEILSILAEERAALEELHEDENDSKWPLFQLACLVRLETTLRRLAESGISACDGNKSAFLNVIEAAASLNEDKDIGESHDVANSLLEKMKIKNPEHTQFYSWLQSTAKESRHTKTFAVLPVAQSGEL
eukprot:gb/GECG01014273.1/.p1 GENE.gb/GECG01014273.1/~~gb/GECG01014273.1/.p1  ORF type:complete len:429 (+),score=73.06 gb/GECG01014273.1/:1-1287(+)